MSGLASPRQTSWIEQAIMNPDKVLPSDAWFVRSSRPLLSGNERRLPPQNASDHNDE